MNAKDFFESQLITDANSIIDKTRQKYSRIDLINFAQVFADIKWNEAIELAAKNATATLKSSKVEPSGKYDYIGVKGKLYFMPFVELESILKLRK